MNLIVIGVLTSIVPFLWLFFSNNIFSDPLFAAANISGLVAAVLFVWQMILGNRFIVRLFSRNYVGKNNLHQTLGKYGVIFAFLHPFGQMLSYNRGLEFVFLPVRPESSFEAFVGFGRMAFYLLLFIWVTSALLRKHLKYRPWLYIHYLSYPMMALVFLHARAIGTFFNTVPWVSVYWNALTIIFVLAVLWRLALWLNIGKKRYTLTDKRQHGDVVSTYTLKPQAAAITPKPGQFIYVRISFWGSAKPYSIMEFDDKSGEIKIGIKAVGKQTKAFASLKKGTTLYIDGPYGVFSQKAQSSDRPKLIFAGGIGVTPFVQYIADFADDQTYMFYSNSHLSEALGRDVFKKKLKSRYVDVVTQESVKGKNTETGRINPEMIKKYLDRDIILNAQIMLCGSTSFMRSVEKMLLRLGAKPENIEKEIFGL